jgi:hypothetical protein
LTPYKPILTLQLLKGIHLPGQPIIRLSTLSPLTPLFPFENTQQASADDEDAAPDEFTLQDRVEWEQDIVASIQHSVGSAFRSASGSPDAAQVPVVVEAFRSVLWPMLGPMLQPANSIELQVLGLCLALDALEFGGPGMHDAAAAVLPTLTQVRPWSRLFRVIVVHPRP